MVFRCSPQPGFRVGLAGSGVYLNLRRQHLAFARWRPLSAFVVAALLGGCFWWAWAFVGARAVCFRPCRFCLQTSRVGLFRFSVGFCFSGCFVTRAVRRLGFASFVASVACQLPPAFSGCPVLAPVVKSGHRWVRRSPHIGANQALWVGGSLALAVITRPNKSVKGTRRPLAVLKFIFYQSRAASLKLTEAARPLP